MRWPKRIADAGDPWRGSVPLAMRLETARVTAVLFSALSLICLALQAWPGLLITVPAAAFGFIRWTQLSRSK